MKGGTFSLRRLQWKLTLSYVLVTLATLLAAVLILFGVGFGHLDSSRFSDAMVEGVANYYEPRVREHLVRTTPDSEGLEKEVRSFIAGSKEEPSVYTGGLIGFGYSVGPGLDDRVLVVDEERRLLASAGGRIETARGERLDAGAVPDLGPVLAALDGEEAPRLLGAISPDGRQMVAAAPVQDEKGNVLGAVVVDFTRPGIAELVLFTVLDVGLLLVLPVTVFGALLAT